ncbi:hypothetical protein GH714_027627 [Hevea brasiliensis]|uniref:C3H1-type domain-containing protein n=1 Tax=Hevea brasiliensis TaxID=3981 RepID=A0A6A6MHH9_HEVBR|nr:hypothetical protein GH714_027627 [Hevea brasiliensis]
MAHRLLRDLEADGWERSDFPIICESCLGDNPYVRMTRAEFDKECKIFQVRDTALSINSNDAIPKSDVNREYFAEEHDRRARAGIDYESSYGKVRPNDTILKLQRTTPYYKRNRAHVCSFYVRGECTRGAECPYRHEMPVTGELSQQNIKDRYYGVNDPVALKLLNKAGEMPSLEPPEDESIKPSMWRAIAFVTYTTREGAEKAAEELSNKLVIKGLRLKLMWGRPQAPKPESEASEEARQQASMAHGGMLPRAVISQQQNQLHPPGTQVQPPSMHYFNIPPPPHQERTFYPSMDPQRMGALPPSQDGGQRDLGRIKIHWRGSKGSTILIRQYPPPSSSYHSAVPPPQAPQATQQHQHSVPPPRPAPPASASSGPPPAGSGASTSSNP